MEMARLHPDLYQSLTERFSAFLQTELGKLARQIEDGKHAAIPENELKVMGDTVVALLAYYAGPSGSPISVEQMVGIVDHVLIVLLTGESIAGQRL